MLENEDIQHILLTRTPALTGRYEFLSFRNAAGGRAWLLAIRGKAQSAADVIASVEKDKRWENLAPTRRFDYAADHVGYRDRLSPPVIEGPGEMPTPGCGAPLKPGEFIRGYQDENGPPTNLPQPESLSRNGSYMAYRRLQEHV